MRKICSFVLSILLMTSVTGPALANGYSRYAQVLSTCPPSFSYALPDWAEAEPDTNEAVTEKILSSADADREPYDLPVWAADEASQNKMDVSPLVMKIIIPFVNLLSSCTLDKG